MRTDPRGKHWTGELLAGHTGVLENRLVRRHTGVQVYSDIPVRGRWTLCHSPACPRFLKLYVVIAAN